MAVVRQIEILTRRTEVKYHMSEPQVTKEDVRHVAALARIDLDESEIARYQSEFETILGYFERLEDVPSLDWSDEHEDVLRDDTVTSSLSIEAALQNAAETEDGFFKGPPVS